MSRKIRLGRVLWRAWGRWIVALTPIAIIFIVVAIFAIGILIWRAFNNWEVVGGLPVKPQPSVEVQLIDAERERILSNIEPMIPKRYQTTIEKVPLQPDDPASADRVDVCKLTERSTSCKTLEFGEESYQQHIGPDLEYWLNIVHSRRRTHYWLHLRQKTTEVEGEVSWAGNYAIDAGEALVFSLGPDQTIRVVRGK